MPIPDLNSTGKQLTDLFKEWIPKINDSVIGKASRAINVVGNPGLSLGVYALNKLSDTHIGQVALKELDDASMATAHIPITPEIKLGKTVASHMDDVIPMLGMAVPAGFRDYLFSTIKVTKKNKYGETKVVDDMVYNTIQKSLDKYAQGVAGKINSTITPESAAESASQKVVAAITDPNFNIPKELHNNNPATLDYIIKEIGNKEIDKLIKEAKQTTTEASAVYKNKDFQSVNPVANVVATGRNAEEAILEAEKPIDKSKVERVNVAGGIFDKLHSPVIKAIYDGIANRRTATEIRKELSTEGVDVSRGAIRNYLDNEGEGAKKIIRPILQSEQQGVDNMSTPDLQKLIISQRKLLGPMQVDKTIEQLKRHGTEDSNTLGIVRRFLMGTQPSQLWHGKSEDIEKRDILLRINTELEKLFKVKGK